MNNSNNSFNKQKKKVYTANFPDVKQQNYKNYNRELREKKQKWCQQNGIKFKRIEEVCKIKSEITKRLSEQHNIKIDESKPLKKEYDNSFNELDALDQYYIIKVLNLNH